MEANYNYIANNNFNTRKKSTFSAQTAKLSHMVYVFTHCFVYNTSCLPMFCKHTHTHINYKMKHFEKHEEIVQRDEMCC